MKQLKDIKTQANKKIKKLNKEFKLKNNIIIEYIKNDHNELTLKRDGTNEVIIKGNYNLYGVYLYNNKTWIWASSILGTLKKNLDKIKIIKNFNYLFEKSDDVKAQFYYQFLNQDAILITNNIMLTWINELLLYLGNDIYPLNPKNNNNIQFLNLSEISEMYN